QARDLPHLALWRDVVQALAIDIHNPPQIAQAIGTRLSEGFWNIPFIDLGVTDQGDVAAWHSMPKVIADVALRQGAKNGCRRPQSYRSRRNGHAIRIFRAAGVGLQAAKIAQRR